jgi:alpha-tubulin suppressor-like RCC1 family protein
MAGTRTGRRTRALLGAVILCLTVAGATSTPAPAGAQAEGGPPPTAFRALAVGGLHSCAILVDGRVKCWGDNFRGQLGVGDVAYRGDQPGDMGAALPAVRLGTGRSATAVTVGNQHSCALLDNGQVKCWGASGSGQLGQGPNTPQPAVGDSPGEMGDALPTVALGTGRTAIAVSAAGDHTCALLDDARVKCWGANSSGQLGQGDTTTRGLGAMGDALPAVSLGAGRTVTSISAGMSHNCAILDGGDVKCWGQGLRGQLGFVGATSVIGDESGEMGDALPEVDLGEGRTATAVGASAVAAQEAHSCALLDDGTVKCWGFNNKGQLGQGDTTSRGLEAEQMGDALLPVDLGEGRTAVGLSVGGASNCAVLDDGSLRCWGWNIAGQLGLGDTNDRGDVAGELGDDLPPVDLGAGRTVDAVSVGNAHACARLDDDSIKCWGQNFYGELGLGASGNPTNRGDQAGEMGDSLPAVNLGDGVPDPSPPCDGRATTVDLSRGQVPTAGPDVILGTSGPDTVDGLGGPDVICGLGGADRLLGGSGVDRLLGGAGIDVLRGGTENDVLDGGTENDQLYGDAGNDRVLGGAGNDRVDGGAGNDDVQGGAGNDRGFGLAGIDVLRGDAGLDVLDGGVGNDRLLGGTQRDTCHGRAGRDTHVGCEVRTGIP